MDESNILLYLPFDEKDSSEVAYDYSQSRADGVVTGAKFVAGKSGNAISFSGEDSCKVERGVLDLSGDFTLLFYVQAKESDSGSPGKLTWLLNFDGDSTVQVPLELTPGTWYSMALVREAGTFRFYVNSVLVETVNNASALLGITLNQNYDEVKYGFGLLDEVKIYRLALTEEEMNSELTNSKELTYTLDGVDLREFGVYISSSSGVLDRPKLKTPASLSWDDYHGESVDLEHKFYEVRDITLTCFLKAESKFDFTRKVVAFERLFDAAGTHRLVIDVHPTKPLIFEVYCADAIEITKEWSDDTMVGTFKLKLVEPEPVKRVLKHIYGGDEDFKTCTVKLTTSKLVNIFWGDAEVSYDISGDEVEVTHEYATEGSYYPVITGCIDEITDFETNAIIVWDRI